MTLVKSGWKTMTVMAAVVGVLMFAGGAWAWTPGSFTVGTDDPCEDIELAEVGVDMSGINWPNTSVPMPDFSTAKQFIQCFVMGSGLNMSSTQNIPEFRTTLAEIAATTTGGTADGSENVGTLTEIVAQKLVGTSANPGVIRSFIRANASKISFLTGELSTTQDDTILIARALGITGVDESGIGLPSTGFQASIVGTAPSALAGTDGFFHFEFELLDDILAHVLQIPNPGNDARAIRWSNPFTGVVSVAAPSGSSAVGQAGSVTVAVTYHGLTGANQFVLAGSDAPKYTMTQPTLLAATIGTAQTATVTLAFAVGAGLTAGSQNLTLAGPSGSNGTAVPVLLTAVLPGLDQATGSDVFIAAGVGGTMKVDVRAVYTDNGTYKILVAGNSDFTTTEATVTISGSTTANNRTGTGSFTLTAGNTIAAAAITGLTVQLANASTSAPIGSAVTVSVTDQPYNPNLSGVTPPVAVVEFGRMDHFATYTNGGVFKITDFETPAAWILDSLTAGKTGAWKPVSLVYAQHGAGTPISFTYTGTSWTSMDKGIKVGNNGQANNVAVGFGDICEFPWTVTAKMQNNTPGRGFGRYTENTCTLTINKRLLSASGITMTATLGDDVYNGKVKTPKIILEDGIRLVENTHYEILAADNDPVHPAYTDAGSYVFTVSGKGPYQRKKSATFVIQKGTLKFDVSTPGMTYKFTKPYDATTEVDTSNYKVDIKFLDGNDQDGPALVLGTDYTVKNLKYNTAPVGTDKIVTMDVTLANTDNTKNWKLAGAKFEAGKQVITKAVPTAENVSFKLGSRTFSLPASIPMDGKLGKTLEAEWKSPFVSSGAKFTITYPENWPTGAKDSLKIDDYEIVLNITEGANTESVKDWAVGTLTVRDPSLPNIDADTGYIPASKEAFYYTGKSAVIGVKAEKPEGGKGTLSYQWYQVVEDSSADRTLSGKTSSTLTVNTAVNVATDFNYYVVVTYTANNEQLPKSVKSDNIKVTGYPKPVSLAGAVIQPTLTYTYDGTEQAVPYSDFTVTLGAQTLNYGEDFTYKGARNNKFAGDGIITIKGINAYEDSAVGTFAINKKAVDILTDISPRYSVVFNGQPQTLAVPTNSPLTGLGAVTVLIGDSLWSTRTNAGEWEVSIAIAEGQNFEALDTTPLPQTFRIRKAIPDTSMFTFSVPAETPFTGEPVTVAAPVAKGLGLLYSATASNVILYNGSAVAPSRLGTYTVELSVLGDANFSSYVIPLGRMTIYDPTISVAEGSREIPNGSVTTEAAVAPVKVSGAGVTFGPNPVNAGSSVSIFWNGSKPVTGKLAVFTEMGKKVETVKVSGTNKIGTWNAAKAPAGTYLVKGVLKAKDGTKVTVNSVVSVGK